MNAFAKWTAASIGAAALGLLLVTIGQTAPARAQSQAGSATGLTACGDIAARAPEGVRITAAEVVAEGEPMPANFFSGPGARRGPPGPEHCLVRGALEERVGADGVNYAINFELRLPARWNGRFLYQGGGGYNGFVAPAIGITLPFGADAAPALQRGYAVVTSDSGHVGMNGNFAVDQLSKINFAYAATGKVTRAAHALINALAGRAPEHSFFIGCSGGGREAMIAAERYPDLFDGVIAANPAFNASEAMILTNYTTATLSRMAPLGADGRPRLAAAFTAQDMDVLRAGMLEACDDLDGAADGMIFNHAACRFDPESVVCRTGATTNCIAAAKVAIIQDAFAGPRDESGRPLFAGWTYDAGIVTPEWLMPMTGMITPDGREIPRTPLLTDALANLMHYPRIPMQGIFERSPEDLRRSVRESAAMIDATSTHLNSFAARGGRMILLTGWSDPYFAPADLIRWYEQLDADHRAVTQTPANAFARLFMVPGMNHCAGGPALDSFDSLTALEDWVVHGRAPDAMIATGDQFEGQSRPICAYPAIAQYRRGDRARASSYACRAPGARR